MKSITLALISLVFLVQLSFSLFSCSISDDDDDGPIPTITATPTANDPTPTATPTAQNYDMLTYWPFTVGNRWLYAQVGSQDSGVTEYDDTFPLTHRIEIISQMDYEGYSIWTMEQGPVEGGTGSFSNLVTFAPYEGEEYFWLSISSRYSNEELLEHFPPEAPYWLPTQPRYLNPQQFEQISGWNVAIRAGGLNDFLPLQVFAEGGTIGSEAFGEPFRDHPDCVALFILFDWELPRQVLAHSIGPLYFFPYALQEATVDGVHYRTKP